MDISIFDRDGTTVQARCLPGNDREPTLYILKMSQPGGISASWFLNAEIATQIRAALEELFPTGNQPTTAPDDAAEWGRLAEYADTQADATAANS